MTLEEFLDAWRANNAITLEMLDATADEDLELKPGKGKTIRSNFVHLIGVRRTWCEEKLKKEAALIPKLDWKSATRQQLIDGLSQTSDLMIQLFQKMEQAIKPGRWTTPMFFAYCIAHEANHRAQIELAWRLNGKEPEDAFLYGLWEWTKK